MQIPSYSGTPSEDFVIFKEKFREAAKDNRISKTNQLETLRETLTGNAAFRIPPDGMTSVDDAWSILEKHHGNQYGRHRPRSAGRNSQPEPDPIQLDI